MEPGARVCPFCGEPPGLGVFCAVCGRNLMGVPQLPTRREWELEPGARLESAGPSAPASAAGAVAVFLASMHAAGDPGATKVRRAEPGFLGRTQHAHGWVVRAVDRDEDDPLRRYEPGLFVTVDGHLHRLGSATRGLQRDMASYVDIVGPEVAEPAHDEHLADELASVLRANGLDAPSVEPIRRPLR
jgi:hypothetical protein